MKKILFTILAAAGLVAALPEKAEAGSWSVGISVGSPGYYGGGYCAPAPVYYAPRPVYYAEPVYYYPRVRYYAPVHYHGYYKHWGHGHRSHRHHHRHHR
jgi:hypothetical protein